MLLLEGIRQFLEMMRGQIVSIPTDNALSWVYVVGNALLLLYATFFGNGDIDFPTF